MMVGHYKLASQTIGKNKRVWKPTSKHSNNNNRYQNRILKRSKIYKKSKIKKIIIWW